MFKPTALLALLSFTLLSGCTSDDNPSTSASRVSGAQASTNSPCFTNSCGTASEVATIPDAENMLFSSDGRLFVSGGTQVFEITKNQNAYQATELASEPCNFTGLAIARGVLYANCGDSRLWAGLLSSKPLRLQPIYSYQGVALANGLVDGPDGTSLYTADGPIPSGALPSPKLVKLLIDPADPLKVTGQSTWLDLAGRFPNGVQRKGNTLFFTDSALPNLGQLNSVAIRPDGTASVPAVVATLPQIPDDFSILTDGFAVTYFVTGQVVKLNPQGEIVASFNPFTFSTGPSQVRVGQAPLFDSSDLLVTEKGILGENDSPIGNKLTVFKRDTAP